MWNERAHLQKDFFKVNWDKQWKSDFCTLLVDGRCWFAALKSLGGGEAPELTKNSFLSPLFCAVMLLRPLTGSFIIQWSMAWRLLNFFLTDRCVLDHTQSVLYYAPSSERGKMIRLNEPETAYISNVPLLPDIIHGCSLLSNRRYAKPAKCTNFFLTNLHIAL